MSSSMYYFMRFFLSFLMMFFACNCYSSEDEEYEYVNTSSWKWSYNSDLKYYSNSTEKLQVFNNNAVSIEDEKNNKWSSKNVWLDIPVEEGKAYTITFHIKNENNPRYYKYKVWGKDKKGVLKEKWHETDIYWGLMFQGEDKYGGKQEYYIYYDSKRNVNEKYTYTSVYDSDNRTWRGNVDIETRTIKVTYDGVSVVKLYSGYGESLMKTINQTKGLTKIGITCGSAAQILVTDFKFLRQTAFGKVLPEIARAVEQIENKNNSSAISILTNVLSSYKGATPYYYRARAYLGSDYYKSAIDDCNNGLTFDCSKELKEKFYFVRGLSKLMLKDDSGVSDMRQGGEVGMRFLRENDLLDYKPGQKVQLSQENRNRSQPNRTNNKTLQSANRTPVLKKTK